jgi:hypothetical protein
MVTGLRRVQLSEGGAVSAIAKAIGSCASLEFDAVSLPRTPHTLSTAIQGCETRWSRAGALTGWRISH